MPAILSLEDAAGWLKTGGSALLKPCPSQSLALWPVSTRVNSPANNDRGLTAEIPAEDKPQTPVPAGKQDEREKGQLALNL